MDKTKTNLGPCHKETESKDSVSLLVTYQLTKGRLQPRCVCGRTESGDIESYFQTIDHANLVIKVQNQSKAGVRHLNATRLRLLKNGQEVSDRLPDGNLLFEIVPDDRYFGDIGPGQSIQKEVALITRGIAPGDYEVAVDFTYTVENSSTSTRLPIRVCAD